MAGTNLRGQLLLSGLIDPSKNKVRGEPTFMAVVTMSIQSSSRPHEGRRVQNEAGNHFYEVYAFSCIRGGRGGAGLNGDCVHRFSVPLLKSRMQTGAK